MPVRITHDSIRIRVGTYNYSEAKRRSLVVVSPSKSTAELIFFREAFKLIDSKSGTNLKRQYTNAIGGYQSGRIAWSQISGFGAGYHAALRRVCDLLEDLFRKGHLDSPDSIRLIAQYAEKVYSFRLTEAYKRGNKHQGHIAAYRIWGSTVNRLKTLQRAVQAKVDLNEKSMENSSKENKVTVVTNQPTPIKSVVAQNPEKAKETISGPREITNSKDSEKSPAENKTSFWSKMLQCLCCCECDDEEEPSEK